MTGRELVKWIKDNHAEDLEVIWVDVAEIVWDVKPTIEQGAEICCSGGTYTEQQLEDEKKYLVL